MTPSARFRTPGHGLFIALNLKIGSIDAKTRLEIISVLQQLFAFYP
jgi:hypothetical protein